MSGNACTGKQPGLFTAVAVIPNTIIIQPLVHEGFFYAG